MNHYLLAALVICAALMWGGWQKIQLQGLAIDQASQQIDTLERAAESRRNTQRLLLEFDTQHTKELTDARKENDQLRADVATGKRRLSVAARCPAVRTAAATAGVDAGEERAELDPAAAERIVRIANDGDDAIRQLNGLRDYLSRVCQPAGG